MQATSGKCADEGDGTIPRMKGLNLVSSTDIRARAAIELIIDQTRDLIVEKSFKSSPDSQAILIITSNPHPAR